MNVESMEIIWKKPEDLKEREGNPRVNDKAVEPVTESIREYGFRVPILIDRDNVIAEGHTRRRAAIEAGLSRVPCIYVDGLTDEQIRAFRIAANKTEELSYWDNDVLREELKKLEQAGCAIVGFTKEELDRLMQPAEEAVMKNNTGEIAMDDFADDRFQCVCPRCGFHFDP